MGIFQVTAILLLASCAISLPMAYPLPDQYDRLRLPTAPDVLQDTAAGTSVIRSKRGYLTTAIAYPPLLTPAIAPTVPIVAPIVTSYSYFGHYGKPAVVPQLIYPHGLTHYG